MWDLIVSVPDHCLSFYFGIFRKIEQVLHPLSYQRKYLRSDIKRENCPCPSFATGPLRCTSFLMNCKKSRTWSVYSSLRCTYRIAGFVQIDFSTLHLDSHQILVEDFGGLIGRLSSQFRQTFASVDELYVLMFSNMFLRLIKHGDVHEFIKVLLKGRGGLLSHLRVKVDVRLHPRILTEF